jgi:superfamily II DNA or RNA helicase
MKQLTEVDIASLLEHPIEERKAIVQDEALITWKANNRRGTFEAATGIGKTKVGIEAIVEQFKRDPDSLVYIVVPTTTLRDEDWPQEFIKWGHPDLIKKVKRICYKSLDKEKPKKDIDLIVFDEIHHFTILMTKFTSPENPWKIYDILGLTATLPISSKSEENRLKRALIDTMAPSIFKIPLEDAIKLELVADFEVKVLKFRLNSTDKNIQGGSKAKPFMTTELAMYGYLTKMIQRMIMLKKEGARFKYIGDRARFLRNLASKSRIAVECMTGMIKPDNRTLIFCGSIEQAEALCKGNTYHSATTDLKLQAFQAKEINYLGVVNALNEGKNVEDLDQILVVQLDSNERNIIQRIGRTIRFKVGKKALVVILVAEATADQKWFEEAFENFDQERITYYTVS